MLASHWQVNDEATGRLMTEFMRRWRAGTPRAQAWQEAQLGLLRSKVFFNPLLLDDVHTDGAVAVTASKDVI